MHAVLRAHRGLCKSLVRALAAVQSIIRALGADGALVARRSNPDRA